MSTTFKTRFYNEPKENDIKYNFNGRTKLLLICLNYQGTSSPLTCITDGKRIVSEAKKAGVTEIQCLYDDKSTNLYPTKRNILNKMAEMSSSCTTGDIFVVYYSGHGSNVPDLDGDQQDAKDEAFCLRSEKGDYEFLSDDDTSSCIAKNLPDNIPCLFIVDACHSGSILDLSKTKIWNNKKVYCISGCQDNQYSNDTGDGGQMTNILLAIIRENQHKRASKQKMIIKNQQIQGNYSGEEKREAYAQLQKSSSPSFLSMCFSALQFCMTHQNVMSSENLFQMVNTFVNFDDQPGQFSPTNEKAQPGQWINLSWCGGSDPTKIPFPF